MELVLLSNNGLPEDSVISVRAGTTRRQVTTASGRAIKFPKLSMEENPVKIDILRPVGSAFLVIRPGESQYNLVFNSVEQPMNVEVALRQTDSAESGETLEKEDKPTQVGAKDAKDYLERHAVLQFVQALLQATIKDRPDKPYEYMARHLMSGYKDDQIRTPNSMKPAAEATTETEETSKAALPAAALESGAATSPDTEPSPELLSPPAAAPAAAPGPPEADAELEKAAIKIQARTRGTMTRQRTAGRLGGEKALVEEALAEATALEEKETKALAPQIAANAPASRDIGLLRATAQESLLEASTSGSLAAALRSLSTAEVEPRADPAPEPEKPAVGEKPQQREPQEQQVAKAAAPSDIDVDALRAKANKALMSGSFEKPLVQVLQARGEEARKEEAPEEAVKAAAPPKEAAPPTVDKPKDKAAPEEEVVKAAAPAETAAPGKASVKFGDPEPTKPVVSGADVELEETTKRLSARLSRRLPAAPKLAPKPRTDVASAEDAVKVAAPTDAVPAGPRNSKELQGKIEQPPPQVRQERGIEELRMELRGKMATRSTDGSLKTSLQNASAKKKANAASSQPPAAEQQSKEAAPADAAPPPPAAEKSEESKAEEQAKAAKEAAPADAAPPPPAAGKSEEPKAEQAEAAKEIAPADAASPPVVREREEPKRQTMEAAPAEAAPPPVAEKPEEPKAEPAAIVKTAPPVQPPTSAGAQFELRCMAQEKFLKAINDGTLETAFANIRPTTPAAERPLSTEEKEGTAPAEVAPTKAPPVPLAEKVVEETTAQDADAAKEAPPVPPVEVETLRQQACSTLIQASRSGALDNAFSAKTLIAQTDPGPAAAAAVAPAQAAETVPEDGDATRKASADAKPVASLKEAEQAFESLDADKDGSVSKKEFVEAALDTGDAATKIQSQFRRLQTQKSLNPKKAEAEAAAPNAAGSEEAVGLKERLEQEAKARKEAEQLTNEQKLAQEKLQGELAAMQRAAQEREAEVKRQNDAIEELKRELEVAKANA